MWSREDILKERSGDSQQVTWSFQLLTSLSTTSYVIFSASTINSREKPFFFWIVYFLMLKVSSTMLCSWYSSWCSQDLGHFSNITKIDIDTKERSLFLMTLLWFDLCASFSFCACFCTILLLSPFPLQALLSLFIIKQLQRSINLVVPLPLCSLAIYKGRGVDQWLTH